MANWKELGVVPDSDDEGFDSEESESPPSQSTQHSPPRLPAHSRTDDVWAFPGSPESPQNPAIAQQKPSSPPANPQPTTQTLDGQDALPPLGEQHNRSACAGLKDGGSRPGRVEESPDPLADHPTEPASSPLSEYNEVSPGVFQATESLAHAPASRLDQERQVDSGGRHDEDHHPMLPENPRRPVLSRSAADAESVTTAEARRSLRPRKPIQEHPYLIEDAKYNRFMKSHGFRPIRLAAQEQPAAKNHNGDDSQDQEFTGDESQTRSSDLGNSLSEKPRQTEHGDLDDYADELALSPSPRTSSPQRQLRAISDQSQEQQTDDSSVDDDDEFPDIRDLASVTKPSSKSEKRKAPPQLTISRKRPKPKLDTPQLSSSETATRAWDLPMSPNLQSAPRTRPLRSPEPSPRMFTRSQGSESPFSSPSKHPEPIAHVNELTEAIDLTISGPESGSDNEESSQTDSAEPDSESEAIRRTVKRIKGVLPASWLRLDQQARKGPTQGLGRRQSLPASPERPRLGLAMRKSGPSRPTVHARSFLEELNEDEDDEDDDNHSLHRSKKTMVHVPRDGERLDNAEALDFDDGASVVEEDHIDRMLPGSKRKRTSSGGPSGKRKKTQQNPVDGQKRKRYRQPKISNSTYRVDHHSSVAPVNRERGAKGVASSLRRAPSPPALSIVDLTEAGAPNFVRIAARAASRRKNMGRSKPSRKNINLGNRADNVDALSVLADWRTGKIHPRTWGVSRVRDRDKIQTGSSSTRQPLRSLSANVKRQCGPSVELSFNQTRKVTRQVRIDKFVSNQEATSRTEGRFANSREAEKTTPSIRSGGSAFRPAQLEADMLEESSDAAFAARKKVLDLVFREGPRHILAPNFKLRRLVPDEENASTRQVDETPATDSNESGAIRADIRQQEEGVRGTTAGRRRRKLVPPKRLDLDAPQFKHANDPLTFFDASTVEEQPEPRPQEQSKILGLGPFGTHYTQHFDVFPLHQDTFFHQTTLIGRGVLKQALDYRATDIVACSRPAMSVRISRQQFHWGPWTDTTSSELGLLFDLLTEQLVESRSSDNPLKNQESVSHADCILKYVLQAASVSEEMGLGPLAQRLSALLLAFLGQTKSLNAKKGDGRTLLEINLRFLICAFLLLRICQSSMALAAEALQAEAIVTGFAKTLIQQLLETGLQVVRETYDDLQRISTRERGIKNDGIAMISWVTAVKILGAAQIPRAGFWDVTYSVMEDGGQLATHDAQRLELLWKDIFTLLPLGEFDDSGVLSKGLRHFVPLQGWSLPQKLLKRVFESYQSTQRQSPSFNEYCRALLGRCHYLIEQWGWHKCVGIVGTIFDFFGHRDLSHLRNEEVYSSPQFLEELSSSPCLAVEPEDRCFHIFLKIVAVALQSMKRRGLSNDIRNLIARCLPNHNRQFSKEQVIHSHDLASLRNHHDLLCTLFWAAPVEHRSSVHLPEKLVQPASSHKEACLINLRAWSQLSRYIVSSGGTVHDYRPFMSWQNNIFQQLLNQYLSAAADVQHQFMSMAKDERKDIRQHMLDSIVSANQTAAKDVLYVSVVASLDVMKHCPSLSAAMFSFNVSQMSKVFGKLTKVGADVDWGIMRACVNIVDALTTRVEHQWYKLRESTADSASHESRECEDAVEFLDDKVVQGFVAAVRWSLLVSAPSGSESHPSSPAVVIEKAVMLYGRIASLFINAETRQLGHFFSAGKYGLFEAAAPEQLSLDERRYLPLFVATLLKNHVFDFSSIGCNHLDMWIMSLVKPLHALRYENYLAETLKALDMGYLKGATVSSGAAPNYETNRSFFVCGISYMRRALRQAETAQKKPLRAKYEKLLKGVMQQMRADIKSCKLASPEHQDYVAFIREIVALIKSHGADVCTVDAFYYQNSAEYSPAKEDPQLHTAGIVAYGLRLGEGDATAVPQLFHYLYNHFKLSLASGQLDAERSIVANGMRGGGGSDDGILVFVVGRMLPAIICAAARSLDIWPLLGVYAAALRDVLGRSCVPREIPAKAAGDVVALMDAVLGWIDALAAAREDLGLSSSLSPAEVHVLTELIGLCNAVRPYVVCWLQQQPSIEPPSRRTRLKAHLDRLSRIAGPAAAFLDRHLQSGNPEQEDGVSVRELLVGAAKEEAAAATAPPRADDGFAQMLAREVATNWVVTPDVITVKVAAGAPSSAAAQPGRGARNDLHLREGLVDALRGELKAWVRGVGGSGGRGGRGGGRWKGRRRC